MPMTDEELVAFVNSEFEDAQGSESGEIGEERARAYEYYLSKPLGNEEEGQSQIVTSDVADVVDGMMPSLLRIFTTAENLIDFDPVSAEDIAKAEQESDYVNHVFFKKNPAFLILYTWFLDALIQKNGIVKCWWDDSEKVTTETYKGLNDAELAELLDDEELEEEERESRIDATVSPEGIEVEAQLHDVVFRRTSKRGQVRVEPVPPEEYRISADARSVLPDDARMTGHERKVTRSELLEMGFDKKLVDELPAEDETHRTREETARRDKSDDVDNAKHGKSEDEIWLKEAYIRVDFDGDGKSELRQVFVANSKVLSNEEADRSAFHVLCPYPLPHKHFGRSPADKTMDVQQVNTTLVRQTLDNLYHTNNPSHGVWEQGIGDNTIDDLLTTRVGSIKRFARPVQESYQPITVPFTAGATAPMLEFWEKVKRDRTGIASDGEGLSPEALKNIQQSVLMQAADLSRMKIEAVVRIFAETGVKSLFRHIHELLQKHQDKEALVRLRNKWVPVNPTEWRTRENMTVTIGLGIGTREQNLLHLNAIREVQKEIVEGGGMGLLVEPKNLYNTGVEIVKNANMKDPNMFFTDPGDRQAPPPSSEQQQLAQMQAELAARQQEIEAREQQMKIADMELKHHRELADLELKRQAEDNKLLVAFEEMQNKLTELELKFNTDVPGSKV